MTTEEIKENIKRLRNSILKHHGFNKNYVANCEAQIEVYKEQLKKKRE